MASGTPVLTTKLPGMPKEYFQYVYTISGNTAADITQALEQVLSVPVKKRQKRGCATQGFFLPEQNLVWRNESLEY